MSHDFAASYSACQPLNMERPISYGSCWCGYFILFPGASIHLEIFYLQRRLSRLAFGSMPFATWQIHPMYQCMAFPHDCFHGLFVMQQDLRYTWDASKSWLVNDGETFFKSFFTFSKPCLAADLICEQWFAHKKLFKVPCNAVHFPCICRACSALKCAELRSSGMILMFTCSAFFHYWASCLAAFPTCRMTQQGFPGPF